MGLRCERGLDSGRGPTPPASSQSTLRSTMTPIYLDYNATTPIDPGVFQAMVPYLGNTESALDSGLGNPSSTHAYGKSAHAAVEQGRRQVAELLGAQPDEIVFTSGGTEA